MLQPRDGETVKPGRTLATWDPHTRPIITEYAGRVRFENVEDGVGLAKQIDEVTGLSTLVVVDPKRRGRRRPRVCGHRSSCSTTRGQEVKIAGSDQSVNITFQIGCIITVKDGQEVGVGEVLARIPQETSKTRDITGGLPRVAELFEARSPKDAGVLAEVTGTVSFGKDTKGKQRLVITDLDGARARVSDPKDKHVMAHDGQVVNKGEMIVDGPADPHDILRLLGVEELARYISNEVQDVYRLQGVKINDKHIEVIVRQMLRRVQIVDPGDTRFITGEQVERAELLAENERVEAEGKQPATLRAYAARHHQGVAVDRFVHLGGLLPGNHARADRSGDHGQARRAARSEGERHRRAPDSGRYRSGLSPDRAQAGRRSAELAAGCGSGRSGAGQHENGRAGCLTADCVTP